MIGGVIGAQYMCGSASARAEQLRSSWRCSCSVALRITVDLHAAEGDLLDRDMAQVRLEAAPSYAASSKDSLSRRSAASDRLLGIILGIATNGGRTRPAGSPRGGRSPPSTAGCGISLEGLA
jgi:hypothetical protein